MFILAWCVILILRSNEVVVPSLVSFIVGLLALIELACYLLGILFLIIAFIYTIKEEL